MGVFPFIRRVSISLYLCALIQLGCERAHCFRGLGETPNKPPSILCGKDERNVVLQGGTSHCKDWSMTKPIPIVASLREVHIFAASRSIWLSASYSVKNCCFEVRTRRLHGICVWYNAHEHLCVLHLTPEQKSFCPHWNILSYGRIYNVVVVLSNGALI